MTRRSLGHDAPLAVGVAVVSMQSAFDDGALKRPAWAVVALILLTALPLALRRVHPVALSRSPLRSVCSPD